SPARRQRLGEWGVAAALLLALLSLAPGWLPVSVPGLAPAPRTPEAPAPRAEEGAVPEAEAGVPWEEGFLQAPAEPPAPEEGPPRTAAGEEGPAPPAGRPWWVGALLALYGGVAVLLLGRWVFAHLALWWLLRSCEEVPGRVAALFEEMTAGRRRPG